MMSTNENRVKVTAIQIEYPDGDVKQISIEDARILFEQLEDLFGKKYVNVQSDPVVVERGSFQWRPHMMMETMPVIHTGDDRAPARIVPGHTEVFCVADRFDSKASEA